MRAFVTRCTGLLGGNLSRLLAGAGHQVVGLLRSAEKGKRLLGDAPVRFVRGDLRAVPAFAHELDGCDVVSHTAAYFREYFQPRSDTTALNEINVQAILDLTDAADRQGVRRFSYVSTAGIIGTRQDGSPG